MTTDVKEWLAIRAEEDRRLYELYGTPLEETHKGEHLAIGPGGETILETDPVELLTKAVAQFGSGNFALARIGYPAFVQWLSLSG